jgi:hypothetical protein
VVVSGVRHMNVVGVVRGFLIEMKHTQKMGRANTVGGAAECCAIAL